ncbi:MAG: Fe-Mn family superoxide dismutase [Chloroherpetonaceae bacterium]|nr:Fe-Mn family superoxide dismutase [Chloroherpetonaceae bacterium]
MPYTAKKFTLTGLEGISDKQLDSHYKLYEGYVTNCNKVNDQLLALAKEGKGGTPEYNEQKRRFGWEFDGMRLHEFYFSNLKANGGELSATSPLYAKLVETWGSYDVWKADFVNTGLVRGIGWAALYMDNLTGHLFNVWVAEHEGNHPAGATLLLIMDVWEHAYVGDYLPTERKKYEEAFMKNINWAIVEKRFSQVKVGDVAVFE